MNYDWTGIAALILALIAIYKGFFESKKIKKDTSLVDADAINSYEKAASLSAARLLSLSIQVDEFEKQMENKDKELKELKLEFERRMKAKDDDLEQLKKDFEDMQDWADRLVHQVISLGGTPVQIKRPKNKNNLIEKKGE